MHGVANDFGKFLKWNCLLHQVSKTTEKGEKITQSVASKRLLKKVDSMISKLDKVLEDLENTEKKIQEGLKADGSADAGSKTTELVRIDEIVNAIRKVQTEKICSANTKAINFPIHIRFRCKSFPTNRNCNKSIKCWEKSMSIRTVNWKWTMCWRWDICRFWFDYRRPNHFLS